jgi:hypothetical protein
MLTPSLTTAKHMRIYAVIAGNDDPANSMAGSSLGSGLWQSDDTGRTWLQLGWRHIKAFSMAHDSNGRTLYLAAGNGVLKSSDHGLTWKVMTDWRIAEVMDVLVHPRKGNVIIAATAHGMIKSTDAGMTWKLAHKGIKQPYASRVHWFNELLYACTEDGLYYSENDARSWTLFTNSPKAVRAATQFKDLVLFGGDSSLSMTGYKRNVSRTATTTSALWDISYWRERLGYIVGGQQGVGVSMLDDPIDFTGPKNVHALATVGKHVLAGTLGDGIWISENLADWQFLALPKSQVWTIKTAIIE